MNGRTAVEIEPCGGPEFMFFPDGRTVVLRIILHTTDPESEVHAELAFVLQPQTGRFQIWGAWIP